MKGLTKIGIAVGLIVWIMSGCSDPGSRESVKTGNSVGEVISDQMQNAEANASDTKPSISDPQTEAAAIEGKSSPNTMQIPMIIRMIRPVSIMTSRR